MDKSPGPGEIHPRMLWEGKAEITGAMMEILISSLVIRRL